MVKLKKLRPRCFFDISIENENVGRIIFELFNEVCPKTCENFKALCTGEKGNGKLTGKPLHYKNVCFHRIVNGFIIQSGDFSQGNGKGGESIYGGTFEDESFHFKHEKPFLLSMANRGKNTNGSQFFITLAPTPHLDGVHVVFGHVISGHDVVLKIANQPVDKQSRPTVPVFIYNCGELVPQIKPKETSRTKKKHHYGKRREESDDSEDSNDTSSSDSDTSSDSSDESSRESFEKRSKNQLKRNEDNHDSKDNDLKNSELKNENSISLFNPKYSVKINPEEIPEIPKNKFLSRNVPINEDKEKNDKEKDRSYVRKFTYTKSGRKIKGRGSIRYRTPSPKHERYRRRSETPPYWKSEQAKLRSFKQIISSNNKQDDKPKRQSRSRSRERGFRRDKNDYQRKDKRDHSRKHNDKRSYERKNTSDQLCSYSSSLDRQEYKDRGNRKDHENERNGKIGKNNDRKNKESNGHHAHHIKDNQTKKEKYTINSKDTSRENIKPHELSKENMQFSKEDSRSESQEKFKRQDEFIDSGNHHKK